ncbi:MAG: NBR1-Ig-like domain-containing protein [Anaerolineae bacterium]|nr:NBR1-Ig-like domain-containing protein [Anaerolineae bacterium]
MKHRRVRWSFITLFLLLTLACSFLDRSAEPTVEPATQEVVQVTVTPEAVASLEPVQTAQTPPTEAPPVTTDGGCTLSAAYVADITIPDNTEVAPGASFTKTWRIRNSGSCTWEEGTQLVFASGEALGGPATVVVPRTTPNSAVDISVTLIGPQAAGTYRSNWQLQAPDGTRYGGIFYTQIVVKGAATEAPTVAAAGPKNLTAAVAADCSKVTLNWTDANGEGAYRIEASGLSVTLSADSNTYNWTSPPAGNQTATVIALRGDGGEIGRVSVTFAVSCASGGTSDLQIESISFDRTPVAYLPVHVTVRVKNAGGAATGSFKLRWWGGKNFSSPSCEWTVSEGLGGNSSSNMECDFIYGSPYGSIPSKAQIDVDNAITESDEGNNTLEKETAVVNPAVVYDFVEKASAASWNSGSNEGQTSIPWNGDTGDDRGFARWVTSGKLETGGTIQGKCLETHPRWVANGWIAATYTDLYNSGYVVQEGDRFRASVGLLEGASAGNVTFKVMLRAEGSGNYWIAQAGDTYGNGFKQIDVDLSDYAGKKADVILRIEAGDSSEQDWACWTTAAIYRYP